MTTTRTLGALFGAAAAAWLLAAGPAWALEDWQLGHGPFVTASDVRSHNKMPLDIRDVNGSLAGEVPDWGAALHVFAFGGNFPNHSLALFGDDYNGRFASHLPVSVAHFGGTGFHNGSLYAALAGTGEFRRAEPAERVAFVAAGLEAVALNWSRYELGESRRKAKADKPNWSLENGSPKNWNEIFAFYWGPEGRHSVHAALEKLEGGPAVNEALLQALADGQELLVKESWAPDHAAALVVQLDKASVLLLSDALGKVAAETDEKQAAAHRARAAGYWLTAAEAVADTPGAADAVKKALAAKSNADDIKAAIDALPDL